jgi:hypothetical protein
MTTSGRFTGEQAPCGRTVGGTRVVDDDDDGYKYEHVTYDCRCETTRRQYHDGGVHLRVLDHHGKVRSDEHSATHEG